MTTIKTFIQKHLVLTYFALTFAISWGSVLLIIGGPGQIPGTSEQTTMLFPIVFVAMLIGPSLSGILLTGLVHGRTGLRKFLSRLLRWRVGARWYAVALLTVPLLALTILFALSLVSSVFVPGIVATNDKGSLLLFGILAGLAAGFFEELGWTGFAVPELRSRYGVLTTGLIVGILWGAWHFLVYIWGSGDPSGKFSLALALPALLSPAVVLPAYRMLMVWVYEHSQSLLVAVLMHASLTASTLIIQPMETSGMPGFIYSLVLAAALWVLVVVVALTNREQLSQGLLRKQAV